MNEIFAITNRGLEDISADEMARLPGLRVTQVAYRRVCAVYNGDLRSLLRLRTVDDIFIDLAVWENIAPQRSALDHLGRLARRLKLPPALEAAAQVRSLDPAPAFSVTANFVGKRNYTSDEIKTAVAGGIQARYGWVYTDEDQSQINIRLFIEHNQGFVGVRLAAAPLHRRPYKQANLPGSLKPTIAAAMLHVAGALPGECMFDPLCGAGTILIEGALSGLEAVGGDNDFEALAASHTNAARAGIAISLASWDALHLPLDSRSVPLVVTNLPWGRQVEVDGEIADFYRQACAEISRVLTSNGQVVALTNLPDLLVFENRKRVSQTEISLFGQMPAIVRFDVS